MNAKISTYESSERSEEVKTAIVAGNRVAETVGELVSLRDSDVPGEYLYLIEDEASVVLDAGTEVEEIVEKESAKGGWYKLMRWLGLRAKQEREEAAQLMGNAKKLEEAIAALRKLSDEVPSDVAKAVLKEQVINLESQKASIDAMIAAKGKYAEEVTV